MAMLQKCGGTAYSTVDLKNSTLIFVLQRMVMVKL